MERVQRIAVIGSGISGLSAAWLLSRRHDVVVYEKDHQVGGHSRTVVVPDRGGSKPVDTGFIVYNERTYPLLTRLFRDLDVSTRPTDMIFGVTCDRCGIEYASTARGLFAAPGNVMNAEHHRMIAAIFRFLREAREVLADDRFDAVTLGEWLDAKRFPKVFERHFLTPLGGAVWSTAPGRMREFPVSMFLRFFENHGFLSARDSTVWRTVVGGSRAYVSRLTERFKDRIRTGAPVTRVRRSGGLVELDDAAGGTQAYDAVVLATHSDQALALLDDPSPDERRLLSAIPYTTNDTVLHTDESILPARRAARASWNIRLADCAAETPRIAMTYDLTRLQSIEGPRRYCVTLNDTARVAPDRILDRHTFEHPHFTVAGLAAQKELPRIQGQRHTWFAGAWTRYGFHEDGLMSGVAAARALGVEY
jgi:predicted NAD/FAD-binding protein